VLCALVSTCPSPSPYPGSVPATALAWTLEMVVTLRRGGSCHERRPRPWDCRDLTIMLACARAVVGACTA
jgi:hypothetical protein